MFPVIDLISRNLTINKCLICLQIAFFYIDIYCIQATGCSVSSRHARKSRSLPESDIRWMGARALFETHTFSFLFQYYLPFFSFFFFFFIFLITHAHHASLQSSPYLSPRRNLRRESTFLWLRQIRLQPTLPHTFSGPYTRCFKSTTQPLFKRRKRSPRFHLILTATPSTATDRLPTAAAAAAATLVRRVPDRSRASRPGYWGSWL